MGNDTLIGFAGADSLYGEGGDDRLVGVRGDDFLYGGAGSDVAVFSGNSGEYTITDLLDGTVEVRDNLNRFGADTLKGVETARFDDGDVALLGQRQAAAGNDFNDDGRTDLLWRDTVTGENAIWLMGTPGPATTVGGNRQLTFNEGIFLNRQTNLDWKMLDTGDFNGDGKEDILWEETTATGKNYNVWDLNGPSFAALERLNLDNTNPPNTLGLSTIPNNEVVGVGDFDGDGFDDLLWRNSSSGQISVSFLQGRRVQRELTLDRDPIVAQTGLNFEIAGVRDFNNDGIADILYRNNTPGTTTAGSNAVWLMYPQGFAPPGTTLNALTNGYSFELVNLAPRAIDPANDPANDWRLEGMADFNNDSIPDLIWRNASNGSTGNEIWLQSPDPLQPNTFTTFKTISFMTPMSNGLPNLDYEIIA